MSQNTNHANHLIHENSPYLLQHAHNPVDWYPWGEMALQKARKEQKMLIISVGYAACHWCHVMEHESYEDPAVAAIMNEYFVNIKVDREERPDIDDIYMTACHLSSNRSCGWPLNAFALPDGRPFWAGTYFPKDQWINILNQFVDYSQNEPDKLEMAAENILKGLKSMQEFPSVPQKANYTEEALHQVHDILISQIDPVKGGKTGQPKFPLPNNYQFLLQHHSMYGNLKSLKAVETTLDQMAFGGIYDQLGGGFARYSTDKDWFAPHFEKMLYDNAQLISLYSDAFRLTKKPLYKKVVRQTMDFIQREMHSKTGGFYSSLDADSEGEEGKFYVWTYQELKKLLDEGEMFDIFTSYYHITPGGNWEHGNNILYRTELPEDFAKAHRISPEEVNRILETCSERLMESRDKRIRPALDDKIITAWNGLMLKACVDAYKALEEPAYLEMAIQNAGFIMNEIMQQDYRLTRSYRNGNANINGFLDDYASMISAFMSLYEVSFEVKWLNIARELTNYTITHFYDPGKATFYYTSDLDPKLISRRIELTDNVIPGSVSMMTKNAFFLAKYLSDPTYHELAETIFNQFAPSLKGLREPSYYSNWLSLATSMVSPSLEIAIIGKNAFEYRDKLNTFFLPGSILLGSLMEENLPLLEYKSKLDKTLIYVCQDKVCQQPVDNVADALEQIQKITSRSDH